MVDLTPRAAADLLTNWLVNKPRRPRGDSRPAIFQAAAHEFAQRGYDAAGVDRIAAKARVNKAMLYYHYGSKQGLYVEVLRDMFRAVGARTRAIADGPGPAETKLDAWIVTIVEEAAARPWFPPIMLRELASGARAHRRRDVRHDERRLHGRARRHRAGPARRRVPRGRSAAHPPHHPAGHPDLLRAPARRRAQRKNVQGLAAAAPREVDEFIRHMQGSARALLRRQT